MGDPLDLLVLGGTSWLGGAVARQALDRGHRVTCLARGQAGSPPDGVTWSRADRILPGAYDEVAGRDWDAVVEVSWQPDQVRSALAALSPRTAHWVYVSSGSVYARDDLPGQDESAPVHPPHADPGPVGWDDYGPAKVACEHAAVASMGAERVLLARAGLLGGRGDRSDRLGYWPARLARARDGERVLVPPSDTPVQVVDADDLAGWLVDGAETGQVGAYDAVGDPTTTGDVLATCLALLETRPELVEATGEWLEAQRVEPWAGPDSLPLWLPMPAYAGFQRRRNDAARAAGLRLRPLAETVAAALAWERELGLDRDRRAGLSPGRERELLGRLA